MGSLLPTECISCMTMDCDTCPIFGQVQQAGAIASLNEFNSNKRKHPVRTIGEEVGKEVLPNKNTDLRNTNILIFMTGLIDCSDLSVSKLCKEIRFCYKLTKEELALKLNYIDRNIEWSKTAIERVERKHKTKPSDKTLYYKTSFLNNITLLLLMLENEASNSEFSENILDTFLKKFWDVDVEA